ncbi:hypothetical protein WME98_29600 [Sorangium sp. So ce296]|uniref:hypothetical protein n=1 Tax=Sorangium sp. So ce296 TaxID=3133296 RepID=UPI003F5D76A4
MKTARRRATASSVPWRACFHFTAPPAYLTESGCGAVNVLLFLAVIALSVFRPSLSLAKGDLPAMHAR